MSLSMQRFLKLKTKAQSIKVIKKESYIVKENIYNTDIWEDSHPEFNRNSYK